MTDPIPTQVKRPEDTEYQRQSAGGDGYERPKARAGETRTVEKRRCNQQCYGERPNPYY